MCPAQRVRIGPNCERSAGMTECIEARLRRLGVTLERVDGNVTVLRGVPARAGRFSKPRTNVLIKPFGPSNLAVVCVDEDLDYTGSGRELRRMFVASVEGQGWRTLFVHRTPDGDPSEAIERALKVLGADGDEPDAAPVDLGMSPKEGVLLRTYADHLTHKAAKVRCRPRCDEAAKSTTWRRVFVVGVGDA